MRHYFHLDAPKWKQFAYYYWYDLVRGRFGVSFYYKRDVSSVIAARVWPTVVLAGTGTVIATIVGLFLGVFAGWRRNSAFDVVSTNFGMIMYAMPAFWFGLLCIMLFATKLQWFPSGGMSEPGTVLHGMTAFGSFLKHLALPVFTFSIAYIGEYQLIMRSSLTGVMNDDFVLTARAKGLSDNAVLWKHTVPNAMLPTVTLVMMNLGFIMSGAILTETVFSWPGLGLLSYTSMQSLDYPVMQGVFLLASVAVIVANLLADFSYYYLDPRVKA
jgi:peptide/nickel transport system permease protein